LRGLQGAFPISVRTAEMDFQKPIPHDVLGIPGYVQFISPIRRYVDLPAYYQVNIFISEERFYSVQEIKYLCIFLF
jgi:exoribonuclease R